MRVNANCKRVELNLRESIHLLHVIHQKIKQNAPLPQATWFLFLVEVNLIPNEEHINRPDFPAVVDLVLEMLVEVLK